MGGSRARVPDTSAQNAMLLKQQQQLAQQQQEAQRQANQYEFRNLGLLQQQLSQQSASEARVAAQYQQLLAAGQQARSQYEGMLTQLSSLQAQQYGINEQRTQAQQMFSQSQLAQSQALADMVRTRTGLLDAQEAQAYSIFETAPARAQNQLNIAAGNYRVGGLQPFTPRRITGM